MILLFLKKSFANKNCVVISFLQNNLAVTQSLFSQFNDAPVAETLSFFCIVYFVLKDCNIDVYNDTCDNIYSGTRLILE